MKRTLLCVVAAATLALTQTPAPAADINFTTGITQDQFKSLSREAGVALGYRNMAPSVSLGVTGFDAGVELSVMSIDKNSTYWNAAFANDAPSYLAVPKIRVRKGLPFGIDVGAVYSYIPDTNINLYGAELSKSIIEGSAASPAVGVRATYTRLVGVDDLALQMYGVDASVSKGFLFITPYAGAGLMQIRSEAKGQLRTLAPTLKDETLTVPRYFGGLRLTPFPLFSVTAEAEYADRPIYSFKAAIQF